MFIRIGKFLNVRNAEFVARSFILNRKKQYNEGTKLPREAHIERQVQWKDTLSKYGCSVSLERTVNIRGANVIVDVYAQVGGKIFLIEIGDIDDKRKIALMRFHAEQNPNIEFVHEEYGENKTQQVLSSLSSYRETQDYKDYLREQHLQKLFENAEYSWMAKLKLFFSVFGGTLPNLKPKLVMKDGKEKIVYTLTNADIGLLLIVSILVIIYVVYAFWFY